MNQQSKSRLHWYTAVFESWTVRTVSERDSDLCGMHAVKIDNWEVLKRKLGLLRCLDKITCQLVKRRSKKMFLFWCTEKNFRVWGSLVLFFFSHPSFLLSYNLVAYLLIKFIIFLLSHLSWVRFVGKWGLLATLVALLLTELQSTT